MMAKWVYGFGGGKAEGKAEMKNLLGGKGANLAEMANLGLPVPPGFTIPTSVCTYFYANDKTYPKDLKAQVDPASAADLQNRYPKAQVRDFDGDPTRLTEMDALVAYLQMLGTLVDVEKAAPQEQAHVADAPQGKAP